MTEDKNLGLSNALNQWAKEQEGIEMFCDAEGRYETLISFEKIEGGYKILEGDNKKGIRESYLNENKELVEFGFTPYERYEEVRSFQKWIGNYWLLEKDSKKGERETIFDSEGNIGLENYSK